MWSTEILALADTAGEIRTRGPITGAYDGWKEADAAARAIERELNETWRRFERGVGAAPSSALLLEAASLRHAARERLGEVVGLLHCAAGG
ncbi:MAG TPA: hypothetical protein VFM98_23505 [Ramlibacter sp.]|uniref:hypothetical protein n=1 Tax=Ramlibacter sp. TaxID=1917967 RepID=UPI002D7E7C80|nr:hypothetical protein [Ramlibacter sp.]HET8748581.1 hypothetical protein [Ramlibacter sp.]